MDAGDNDTSTLLTNAATALDQVEPIDPAVLRSLATPGASSAATALSRIAPSVVPEQAEALRPMVSALRGTSVGTSSLTTTELRIIPFLATYLSLGEIAERMHVSRNTIKTHTNSIYQRLGVSFRSEANGRPRSAGARRCESDAACSSS